MCHIHISPKCDFMQVMVCFSCQLNTGQFNSSFAGADHKIQRAWIQGLTGCGVTVAVVDDGNRKVLLPIVLLLKIFLILHMCVRFQLYN